MGLIRLFWVQAGMGALVVIPFEIIQNRGIGLTDGIVRLYIHTLALIKALPAVRYQDVSDLIPVTPSALKLTLDRVTRKMTSGATFTLRNSSPLDVKAPIRLMLDVGGANVVVVGAKVDESGRTYLEVPNQLLKPGDAIAVDVQFVYASTVKFTYATKVFGGVAR